MSGWIKLHRRLQEWEWYTDSKTVHLFIHILIKCNHESNTWRGVTVNPGQCVTSRDKLSGETGISSQSIRTILKRLQSTNEIAIQSTNYYTIITVCNWEVYQSTSQEGNQPTNHPANHPANHQSTSQLTTNKKYKNEEEIKEGQEKEPVTLAGTYPKTMPLVAANFRGGSIAQGILGALKKDGWTDDDAFEAFNHYLVLKEEERRYYNMTPGKVVDSCARLLNGFTKQERSEPPGVVMGMRNGGTLDDE